MSMHRFRHKTPHHRPRTYSRLFSKAFRPRSRSVITTKGPWLNHTENITPGTIKSMNAPPTIIPLTKLTQNRLLTRPSRQAERYASLIPIPCSLSTTALKSAATAHKKDKGEHCQLQVAFCFG